MVTIEFWSDIACPWASLAVFRLHSARERLGLLDDVQVDLRAWPLELVNSRPTFKRSLDAETAVIGSHEPGLKWNPWRGPSSRYPVSTLLALEAVQACKADAVGGVPASEQLDLALRHAFFADSRCISLYDVIIDVAKGCDRVKVDALVEALERGRARAQVFGQWRASDGRGVESSPHMFLPDGTGIANPGITHSWTDAEHGGYPVIEDDDPDAYDKLLSRAIA